MSLRRAARMHILSDTSTTPGLGLNRPNGDERRPDAHRFVGANMAPNRAFGPNEAMRVRTPFVAIRSVQIQPGRCGRVREDMHACSTSQQLGKAVVANLYLCRIMHAISMSSYGRNAASPLTGAKLIRSNATIHKLLLKPRNAKRSPPSLPPQKGGKAGWDGGRVGGGRTKIAHSHLHSSTIILNVF